MGILGGLLAAVAKVTVRRLSRTEPTTRTVFYFALVGTLVSALPLAWVWQTPATESLLWLLAVAVCATLGQLLMTRGFSLAPIAQLATFTYFSAVFGAAYGWVFWQEAVRWTSVLGAVFVAAAGLLAARGHADQPEKG